MLLLMYDLDTQCFDKRWYNKLTQWSQRRGLLIKSMLKSLIFEPDIWLPGGCAARQSDARFESVCWLAWNLISKFSNNIDPGQKL